MFPKLNEIKRIRERVGMSQAELAQRVGVSQSAIPKYESGKQVPSYEIATKIFDILLDEDVKIDPTVLEIMEPRLVKVQEKDTFGEALELMKKYSISQIPVMKSKIVVGTISESLTLDLLDQYRTLNTMKEELVGNIMNPILPIVPHTCKVKEITPLLKHYHGVLVLREGLLIGIVTKADLLKLE